MPRYSIMGPNNTVLYCALQHDLVQTMGWNSKTNYY